MSHIKNYTSTVPVFRTVGRIEEIVAKAGANGVQKDYEQGRLTALCFQVEVLARKISIRLPANVQAVYDSLKSGVKRPRPGTLENLRDQAERTAWKLMQDWVEVQLALIQLQQADWLEVFLPYVWDGNQTFYSMLKENKFKALMLPEK